MALYLNTPCFYGWRQRALFQVKASMGPGGVGTKSEEDEKVKLGASDLKVTKLGLGAWSWGDTTYWNNSGWDDRKMKAAKAAFEASVDCGITFFDTAEVYGAGFFGAINSETLLGRFIKERKERKPEEEIVIATKFAALPWRLGRQSVVSALKDSLNRLEVSSVELYQLHWPGIWGNEGYIDGLGDAVEQGLVKAVGVSNYSEKRLRAAYDKLKKRGIPLASNQVNYSLIYRYPEENGVKAACEELGVTLIAYSPIAQGKVLSLLVSVPSWQARKVFSSLAERNMCNFLRIPSGALSGKYTPANPPSGPRGQIYTSEFLTKVMQLTQRALVDFDLFTYLLHFYALLQLQPLVNRIKEIGLNYNKTPTQVVLNWLIAQGNVVPIPGAKNAEQAQEFSGALGWLLSKEEVDELRSTASGIKPVIGFPVEKL